jgi:peptidoglycan-N-acetylglucosamine deacetylase
VPEAITSAGLSTFVHMHRYFIKTPWLAKVLFPSFLWRVNTRQKEVYLTFDDGPHEEVTPWVLDLLQQFNAKATFFCIGKNVAAHPGIYEQILSGGHAVGNHTYNHLNGWKVSLNEYVADIQRASPVIDSNLFRPPYGKIKLSQSRRISSALKKETARIVMWDVLSADFDQSISSAECLQNVLQNYTTGSVIVFHDSEKAFPHLKYTLPLVLEHLYSQGYICRKIEYVR